MSDRLHHLATDLHHVASDGTETTRLAPRNRPKPGVVLKTLQFAWGGLFDSEPVGPIHLIAQGGEVKPEHVDLHTWPTLCGLPRRGDGVPGWSVGGGVSGPGIPVSACLACARAAREHYPDAPVWGSTFRDLFGGHRVADWSEG